MFEVWGNPPPEASFTESAHTVNVGETISFDASASSDDGIIVSYDWDFGDGATGTGVTTTHAYTDAGTYTVTLTATDDDGLTDTATAEKTVIIEIPPPPEASITLSPNCGPEGVDVDVTVTGRGFTPSASVRIYFDDTYDLGTATAVTGSFVKEVTIPADFADTQHTVTATDDTNTATALYTRPCPTVSAPEFNAGVPLVAGVALALLLILRPRAPLFSRK